MRLSYQHVPTSMCQRSLWWAGPHQTCSATSHLTEDKSILVWSDQRASRGSLSKFNLAGLWAMVSLSHTIPRGWFLPGWSVTEITVSSENTRAKSKAVSLFQYRLVLLIANCAWRHFSNLASAPSVATEALVAFLQTRADGFILFSTSSSNQHARSHAPLWRRSPYLFWHDLSSLRNL